jgi:hypothetical protein
VLGSADDPPAQVPDLSGPGGSNGPDEFAIAPGRPAAPAVALFPTGLSLCQPGISPNQARSNPIKPNQGKQGSAATPPSLMPWQAGPLAPVHDASGTTGSKQPDEFGIGSVAHPGKSNQIKPNQGCSRLTQALNLCLFASSAVRNSFPSFPCWLWIPTSDAP